jgi:putative hydrolase of the HAD superfamily
MRRCLVFDLDDTLFPENAFVDSGFRAVGAWLSDRLGIGGFADAALKLHAAGIRGTVFDRTLEHLGVAPDPKLIADLVAVYRGHWPKICLHPDAAWALNYFRSLAWLGLLTDGPAATQRNKVAALGIGSRFDVLVYSDDHGRAHWKPDHLPYQKLMEATRCEGPNCVYVGDNPWKDFAGARELGWQTVQVCRADGLYSGAAVEAHLQAHHRLGSLLELPSVLAWGQT